MTERHAVFAIPYDRVYVVVRLRRGQHVGRNKKTVSRERGHYCDKKRRNGHTKRQKRRGALAIRRHEHAVGRRAIGRHFQEHDGIRQVRQKQANSKIGQQELKLGTAIGQNYLKILIRD